MNPANLGSLQTFLLLEATGNVILNSFLLLLYNILGYSTKITLTVGQ